MNLIVHPEADEEIQAAVRYYEGSRPGLGDDFLAELRTHLERIADDPLSLPKLETAPKRLDIRRTLILRFKHVVVFEVVENEVFVLAVAHGSTQREFADHLRIAPETVSRWMTGLAIQNRALDSLTRIYFSFPVVRRVLLAAPTQAKSKRNLSRSIGEDRQPAKAARVSSVASRSKP